MTNSWLKEHLLSSTMIVGLVAGLAISLPSAVLAQEDDDTDDPAVVEEDDEERIIVTGSRIARDTFTSAAPLQVIEGQVVREAGLLDTAEILQTTNVVNGLQIDSTFGGFVLDNGPGASTVGLRGLNPERTLVLINGRRLAPSGVEGAPSAPDLNLIPSSIVQRFEILLDGASSVYGSDAIAGVVNVILRQDFDGFQVDYARDFVNGGEGETQQVSATWGISSDRGYMGFAGEYYRREQYSYRDIPNGECDYHVEETTDGEIRNLDQLTNFDIPGTSVTPCKRSALASRISIGIPYGSVYWRPDGFSNLDAGILNLGLPYYNETTGTLFGVRPIFTGTDLYDGNGDGLADIDINDGFYNSWDENVNSDFISPLQRFNFYTYGEYDLRVLGDSKVFFEASYANRESRITSGQPQLFPSVPVTNPFNPCGKQSTFAFDTDGDGINDVNKIQNPDSVDCVAAADFAWSLLGFGPTFITNFFGLQNGQETVPIVTIFGDRNVTETEVQQVRAVAGLRGNVDYLNDLPGLPWFRDWTYELAGSYTRSTGLSTRRGIREDRLALSLGTSRRLPDDTIECGLDFDGDGFPDSVGSFEQFGFLDDGVGCVPVNLFTAGVMEDHKLTPEEEAFLFGMRRVNTIIEQSIVSGYMSGTVYDLPGGPMGFVVGFEWRDDEIVTESNDVAAQGLLAGFFEDRGASGSRDLHEWFFETSMPILANHDYAKELTFNASARWTEEENYGAAWTYSLNGVYRPVDWVMVRGTYGTSFRAPNLREAFFNGSTGFIGGGNDLCIVPNAANDGGVYNPAGDTRDPVVRANCDADLLAATGDASINHTTLGLFGFSSVQVLTGGTEDLNEETSTAWTAGVVVEQPWWDDFSLRASMTYSDIDVSNTIEEPGAGFIFNDCLTSDPLNRSDFCSRIARNPDTGFVDILDASFINIGTVTSRTLDYNLFFGTDFTVYDRGLNITLDVRATQQLEQFFQVIDTSDDNVGEPASPEWRASANLLAQYNTEAGNFRFQWLTRFIQGGVQDPQFVDAYSNVTGIGDTCFGPGLGDVNCRDVGYTDDYFVHNASLTWEWQTWAATAGLTNVLDEWPSAADSSEVFVSRHGNIPLGVGYDLHGRSLFINVAKRF